MIKYHFYARIRNPHTKKVFTVGLLSCFKDLPQCQKRGLFSIGPFDHRWDVLEVFSLPVKA